MWWKIVNRGSNLTPEQDPPAEDRSPGFGAAPRHAVQEALQVMLPALVLAMGPSSTCSWPRRPSSLLSMEPNLHANQRLIVDKLS